MLPLSKYYRYYLFNYFIVKLFISCFVSNIYLLLLGFSSSFLILVLLRGINGRLIYWSQRVDYPSLTIIIIY